MKRSLFLPFIAAAMLVTSAASAQGKKPASPPAKVSEKIASGATITINYSQPSVKGRTIGKDLEPLPGKVWRTGADKATVFETDKDVTIEGVKLPAGKYGLFTILNEKDWTIILNKTWDQWGAFKYKQEDDVLRASVPIGKAPAFTETFTINIGKDGKVSLLWGDHEADFTVK